MELGSVTLKKSPTSTAVGATTWKVKVLSAPFFVELVSSCALNTFTFQNLNQATSCTFLLSQITL